MKLTSFEEEFRNYFVECRSNGTSKMVSRSATVDTAVKWQLNLRKRIEFAHKTL
jgi:hypothetical protein